MRDGKGGQQITKSVAGCGRLTATSDPTGHDHVEPGSPISFGTEAEPGHGMDEAGSATAGALAETA